MAPLRHLSATLILLTGLIAAPTSVRAAQSYDSCTGFITSLPTTISTQGTWCLNQDLSTAMVSGDAIIIATNNVTIDCNDFKLGGLAAGPGTTTRGIYALDRLNTTVRHCNIRGFLRGVFLEGAGGGGHVVEDNRFDGNTFTGIRVVGDGSVVRRNLVRDTGGSTAPTFAGQAFGIETSLSVDILDNTISDVLPGADAGNATAHGIHSASNFDGSISGNRVRGLVQLGTGTARGIYNLSSDRISLDGNHVVGNASVGSIGLRCASGQDDSTKDNIISGFATSFDNCDNDVDNVNKP